MQLDNLNAPNLSLRERLADWTDLDVAQYHLGLVLGVLPERLENESDGDHFRRLKGVFWAANPLGDILWEQLCMLTKHGMLEQQPEEDGTLHSLCPFRFSPSWVESHPHHQEPLL